jgi:hypothetical protein
MNLAKGATAGLIAAILGALAWAAIVYAARLEIGYLAWGIGGLVGFAVAWGTRGGGAAAAVLAVLLTVVSIAGGKYLAAQWIVNKDIDQLIQDQPTEWSEEYTISFMADEVLEARALAGQPAVGDDFSGEAESDYPADVWAEARKRWDAMDQAGRDGYAQGRRDEFDSNLSEIRREAAMAAFTADLGVIDIVFFVLGVATAWQIAFRDVVGGGGSAEGT